MISGKIINYTQVYVMVNYVILKNNDIRQLLLTLFTYECIFIYI